MRLLALFVVAVAVVCTVFWASPAEARRKKKPAPKNEPLDIVVLPFGALTGKKANEAKDALELELELVDNARVLAADQVLADLDEAGDNAWSPNILSRVLKKRGIEVLVGTPPSGSKPIVVAWAQDGQPRVMREVAAGASPDQIAATTLSVLKPALAKWSTLKPLKLAAPPAADDGDDDVLTRSDDEDDEEEDDPPVKKAPNPPVVKKPKDPSDDESRRRTRSLDDDEATPKPKKERSRVVDDDEEAAPRRRRAALDETDLSGLDGERRSLLDVETGVDGGNGEVKPTHLLALSGTFDGATWYYGFEGNDGVQPDPVQANFYPGGSVRADLWPFENIGIDATGSLAAVQFAINSNAALTIKPNKFISWHTAGAASLKARYLFRFADEGVLRLIGFGGRLGYRYWGATVDVQTIDPTGTTLTVVPGFQLHGLAVGPELYLPLFLPDRRFEIELKIDTLPATFYSEQPDNPGGASLAFGYHAELLLRFDLFGGFFLEAVGKSTGATINFEGPGDRVTVNGANNDPITLQGGRSVNVAAGFSVGVGFMY